MKKGWKISDEKRQQIEKGLTVLVKDHVDFIKGKKPKKDYPSFQVKDKKP